MGVSFRYRALQRLFLTAVLLFLGTLIVVATLRSSGRRSLIERANDVRQEQDQFGAIQPDVSQTSALRLQDFHRIQVKDGRPVWEVRASDAMYYSAEELAHVNDAHVTMYREDGSAVRIRARAGKLHLSGQSLERAELEGDVHVALDESMNLVTERATYDSVAQLLICPDFARVFGPGYTVEGNELRAHVDTRVATFGANVRSRFEKTSENAAQVSGDISKVLQQE
ncbi:MAG: LPS export ABC transporter periplasmic protein LptC [Bdellovibrionales bacterium]|nr:LPS export ABC transporter periplasmic protein LptC [Bdellovibrionales bacterium]